MCNCWSTLDQGSPCMTTLPKPIQRYPPLLHVRYFKNGGRDARIEQWTCSSQIIHEAKKVSVFSFYELQLPGTGLYHVQTSGRTFHTAARNMSIRTSSRILIRSFYWNCIRSLRMEVRLAFPNQNRIEVKFTQLQPSFVLSRGKVSVLKNMYLF